MKIAENENQVLPTISDRLLNYAALVIELTNLFPSKFAAKHIGSQLIRSCTSIGANYEESRGAQSRQDFVHKLQISLKEAKETLYWSKLSEKLNFTDSDRIAGTINEGQQIQRILAKAVVTAKQNQS